MRLTTICYGCRRGTFSVLSACRLCHAFWNKDRMGEGWTCKINYAVRLTRSQLYQLIGGRRFKLAAIEICEEWLEDPSPVSTVRKPRTISSRLARKTAKTTERTWRERRTRPSM